MGSLTFQFAGICTHFRYGVAAGVPHRVVLPDATKFLTGFLTVAADPPHPQVGPVLYYITPHFPQLDLRGRRGKDLSDILTIDGLIERGDILSGIRVQVANAIDREMSYEGTVPSLTHYVPNYSFSSEVVLNGRAACYVDIYGGSQTTVDNGNGKPQTVLIKVQTEGLPALLVSSLSSAGGPAKSFLLTLGTKDDEDLRLIVKNLEADPEEKPAEESNGAYDYLLHYLTARGGIPQVIHRNGGNELPPGMPDPPRNAPPESIGVSLIKLGEILALPVTTGKVRKPARRRCIPRADTTPACSDSQYP